MCDYQLYFEQSVRCMQKGSTCVYLFGAFFIAE